MRPVIPELHESDAPKLRQFAVLVLAVLVIVGGVWLAHWSAKSTCVDYGGGSGYFSQPNCYTMNGGVD